MVLSNIYQIDKDIAKAFSNKPTLKKTGIAVAPPVAPGANPPEAIKGAQKGNIYVFPFLAF